MQIDRIEIRDPTQLIPIYYFEPIAISGHCALSVEDLKHTVDVHRRHSRGVADLSLSHWQFEIVAVAKTRCLATQDELAKHVSNARFSIASPDIEDPFPKDRSVDQAIAPKRLANVWLLPGDFEQISFGDPPYPGRRNRFDRVIGLSE